HSFLSRATPGEIALVVVERPGFGIPIDDLRHAEHPVGRTTPPQVVDDLVGEEPHHPGGQSALARSQAAAVGVGDPFDPGGDLVESEPVASSRIYGEEPLRQGVGPELAGWA